MRGARLDPENPPKTWAAVKQAAITIAGATEADGFVGGIIGPSAGDWLFQGVVRSNGGDVLSADRKTLTFAEPPAVEAVAMLRDLYDSGAMPNLDINAGIEAMASGNLGMYLQTSAVQSALLKGAEGNFELRASAMPSFGDKPVRGEGCAGNCHAKAARRAGDRQYHRYQRPAAGISF